MTTRSNGLAAGLDLAGLALVAWVDGVDSEDSDHTALVSTVVALVDGPTHWDTGTPLELDFTEVAVDLASHLADFTTARCATDHGCVNDCQYLTNHVKTRE